MSDREVCYNIVSNIIKKYNTKYHNQTLALCSKQQCTYSSNKDEMGIRLYGISSTTFRPIVKFFKQHRVKIDIAFENNTEFDNEFWIKLDLQSTLDNYKDYVEKNEDDDDNTLALICCVFKSLKCIVPLLIIIMLITMFYMNLENVVFQFIYNLINKSDHIGDHNTPSATPGGFQYDFANEDDVFADINSPNRVANI